MGNFCILVVFERYLINAWSKPNFICVGTMSSDVPLPPLGSIGPNGGFVSVVLTHLIISITVLLYDFMFSVVSMC